MKFDNETEDKIAQVIKKVISLAESNSEITISTDEYAYLSLADDKDFPGDYKRKMLGGKELLNTGNYMQVGQMKIKVTSLT